MRFFRTQHWTFHILLGVFLAYSRMDYLMSLILPVVFCQQAFLFASNDYFDREIDAQDPKKRNRNVLSSGELSLKKARSVLGILVFASVALSACMGIIPFLVNSGWLILAAFYTAPPIRFKKRVGFDLLVHGITVLSFPFLFAMVASGSYTVRNGFIGVVLVCISLLAQVLQEVRDFETDSLIERNTVIALGLQRSFGIILVILFVPLILSSFLVVTGRISVVFSIVGSLCLCWMYDLHRTWRTGRLTEININAFGDILRRTAVCMVPVVLAWIAW